MDSISSEIIELTNWLETPIGQYLLSWEQTSFDEAVSDIFGYHALQLGLPELNALQSNRMPHKWLAATSASQAQAPFSPQLTRPGSIKPVPESSPRIALLTDAAALPFAQNSLDLVLLPHTLELNRDPHSILREVERVLVPEGRVVISGFNPASLWGLSQRRGHFYRHFGHSKLFLPENAELIGYWRLLDWLRLLGFEVESTRFGGYRPALNSQTWLNRCEWMDAAGARWWPIFGAVYFLVAVKHVRGMRLLEPSWKSRRVPAAAGNAIAGKEALSSQLPSD